MNDRYLYRAKHVHVLQGIEHLEGRWIEGYLSDENHINSPKLEGEFLIDPSTICQCTGLKDKNGKLIWENDVVNCYESECFGVIKWEEDEVRFIFDIVLEDLAFEPEDVYDYIDDMEVVGNVFDNPELLEVEE